MRPFYVMALLKFKNYNYFNTMMLIIKLLNLFYKLVFFVSIILCYVEKRCSSPEDIFEESYYPFIRSDLIDEINTRKRQKNTIEFKNYEDFIVNLSDSAASEIFIKNINACYDGTLLLDLEENKTRYTLKKVDKKYKNEVVFNYFSQKINFTLNHNFLIVFCDVLLREYDKRKEKTSHLRFSDQIIKIYNKRHKKNYYKGCLYYFVLFSSFVHLCYFCTQEKNNSFKSFNSSVILSAVSGLLVILEVVSRSVGWLSGNIHFSFFNLLFPTLSKDEDILIREKD
jgi:hypothetical protein